MSEAPVTVADLARSLDAVAAMIDGASSLDNVARLHRERERATAALMDCRDFLATLMESHGEQRVSEVDGIYAQWQKITSLLSPALREPFAKKCYLPRPESQIAKAARGQSS